MQQYKSNQNKSFKNAFFTFQQLFFASSQVKNWFY